MAQRNYRGGGSRVPPGTQPEGIEEQLETQDAVTYNEVANQLVADGVASGRTPNSIRYQLNRLRGLMQDKAATDAAGLAPTVRAREAEKASLNEDLESEFSDGVVPAATGATRPAPGSWRASSRPGVSFERYDPSRGGIETVTNKEGTVYSGFVPYTPPPVDRKQSFAQAFRIDLPKRQETMRRFLVTGDIPAAERERAAIESFIEENATELHRVSRYSGDDRYLKGLSDKALGYATGSWLSKEEQTMFLPAGNPAYRSSWSRRAGSGPLFEDLLRRSDSMTDPAATEQMAALGVALGGTVPEAAPNRVNDPREDRQLRAASTVTAAMPTAADAEAYLSYEAAQAPSVFRDTPVSARDRATVLGKLFQEGDHDYLDGQLARLVGEISETDPGMLKPASSNLTGSWLPAWMEGRRPDDVTHKRMFSSVVDGVADAIGSKKLLVGASDQVAGVLRDVAKVVDADAGGNLDSNAVRTLAKVTAARRLGRQGSLKGDEARLSASLATADKALANLTVSLPVEAGLPEEPGVDLDPVTGKAILTKRPPAAETMYPAFKSLKGGMEASMNAARVMLASNPKMSLDEALAANAGFVDDMLVIPKGIKVETGPRAGRTAAPSASDIAVSGWAAAGGVVGGAAWSPEEAVGAVISDPGKAKRAAAELLLKGWAANSDEPFDLRKIHETLVKQYGSEIVKTQVDDYTTDALRGGAAGKTVASDAKAAAAVPKTRFSLQDKLYSNITGNPVTVNGKPEVWKNTEKFKADGWDWEPGDYRGHQLWKKSEDGLYETVAEVMSPGSRVSEFIANLPVTSFTSDKERAGAVANIATVIGEELRGSIGTALADGALAKSLPAIAEGMAREAVEEAGAIPGLAGLSPEMGKQPLRGFVSKIPDFSKRTFEKEQRQPTVTPDAIGSYGQTAKEPRVPLDVVIQEASNALVDYFAPAKGATAGLTAVARANALGAAVVPAAGKPSASAAPAREAPAYTAPLLNPLDYEVRDQAAALNILKSTAEAAEAPVNNAMKAAMLDKLDSHLFSWVTRAAQDAYGSVDKASTRDLNNLIANAKLIQAGRAEFAKERSEQRRAAANTELRILEAQAKGGGESGEPGLDPEAVRKRLAEILTLYGPVQ